MSKNRESIAVQQVENHEKKIVSRKVLSNNDIAYKHDAQSGEA